MWAWKPKVSKSWSFPRGLRVAALSAAAGLAALSPLGGGVEETYGLGTLFRVRGPAAAPANVVVVAVDRASADRLGLPAPPRRWLRTFHADLVEALDKAGAKAIVFDLLFAEEGGAAEDEDLALAMRRAGRVALLQGLQRRTVSAPTKTNGQQPLGTIIEAVEPIATLRGAAVAVAPFPLPTDSALVTSFWTFLSGTDLPTLPSVALQLSASDIAEDWAGILAAANIGPEEPRAWTDRRIVESMTGLRGELKANPGIESRLRQAIGRLEEDKARRLSALLSLYAGEDSRLLNFLGPAATIRTIPYDSIISGNATDAGIAGKIVFVGLSEREAVINIDSYDTVYSDASGLDLSGVEILATALSNLTDDTSLRASGVVNVLVVIGIALILGLAAATASDFVLTVVGGALLLGVPALGYSLFVSANVVVPVFTPIAVEIPVGILTIALSLRTAERKLRQAVEDAVRQLLPQDVFERLASGPLSPNALGKTRSGIFLATDIEGFTTVAERLAPADLSALVKDYFKPLFETVRRRGGEVLDVTGDSMMCVWYAGDGPPPAADVIAATLDMRDAVAKFGLAHPSTPLPTRFGLRAGTVAVGIIGGSGRYVASVVGDVTNTASRIDSLNKLLRTRVLASAEVVAGVEGLIVRPLGTFAPVGKSESVDLVEIMALAGETPLLAALARSFAAALATFYAERWSDAVNSFRTLREAYPDDGPTPFFLDLAEGYSANPPPPGTARPIRVNVK